MHGSQSGSASEQPPSDDPTDNRIELFRSADGSARDASTKTVVVPQGGIWAQASSYGNDLTYTPSDRAARST